MTRLTDDDHHCRGFSLIEMAIVTVIIGFILAAMLESFSIYRKNDVVRTSNDHLAKVHSAIMAYAANGLHRNYPRPAPRNLQIGQDEYGKETPIADLPALDSCNAFDVCRVSGARDMDGDTNPDPVLIGAIPFKSMAPDVDDINAFLDEKLSYEQLLSIKDTYDGWGRQFGYAVTESLTNPASYIAENGAIDIRTEAGTSLVEPAGSAHLIVWSGGENGAGVYTADAVRIPCNAAVLEGENCDEMVNFDANFISGVIARADAATYYDDMLRFHIWGSSQLWRLGASAMWNTNPGNVGIGTDTPQNRLHVATGDIEATRVLTNRICDNTGGNCLDPNILGGTGIRCPNPTDAVKSINNSDVNCAAVISPPVTNTGCPAGQLIQAFNMTTGLPVCTVP